MNLFRLPTSQYERNKCLERWSSIFHALYYAIFAILLVALIGVPIVVAVVTKIWWMWFVLFFSILIGGVILLLCNKFFIAFFDSFLNQFREY